MRHTHSSHTEINNEIDHPVILTGIRTHRNCHYIHRHCPIVKPKTTCCHAIAVAVHQNITWTHSSHPQFPGIEIRPVVDILLCREDWYTFTSSATCCMYLYGSTTVTRLLKCHPIRY